MLDVLLVPMFQTLSLALRFLTWLLVADTIVRWLLAARILRGNDLWLMRFYGVRQAVETLYGHVRTLLPRTEGLDLAPLVCLLGIYFLGGFLDRLALHCM